MKSHSFLFYFHFMYKNKIELIEECVVVAIVVRNVLIVYGKCLEVVSIAFQIVFAVVVHVVSRLKYDDLIINYIKI